MTVAQTRLRHKSERSALASAQKNQRTDLTNVWKGELRTVQFARKQALERLTTGSGWSQKSPAQKKAEKGAFTRSYASNIENVRSSTKIARAALSVNHKNAKAAMSSRHKSEIASFGR